MQHVKKMPVILIAAFLLLSLSAFQANAAPTVTTGGLLHYSSQAEFETAYPGLPVEDFEESTVVTSGVFAQPLNSGTSNAYFSAGDILPGITITTEGGNNPGVELIVTVAGQYGWTNTSKAITNNYETNNLTLDFSTSYTYTVGMDLFMRSQTSGSIDVNVYTDGNTLVDTVTVTLSSPPTFAGIHSPVRITKITFQPTTTEFEGIDNIQFGGGATFYTSQATFESANPGLPVEDFEESTIGDTGGDGMVGPINSTTTNAYFTAGDILDGLQLNSVPSNNIFTIGGNFSNWGNTSKTVGSNITSDYFQIDFLNNDIYNPRQVYSVGMDVMFLYSPQTATFVVYGPSGVILGVTEQALQTTASFFGVYSNQPISRIDIIDSSGVDSVMVDNIQFGGLPMGLTFYTSQTTFPGGLKSEDFTESPVAESSVLQCDEPIDSSTNNSCFSTGDITAGVSFSTVDSISCPTCMTVFGDNSVCGNSPKTLGTFPGGDRLQIDFSGKVKTAGFYVYNSIFLVYVYGENDELLGSAYVTQYECAGGFWGVKSKKTITRLVLGQVPTTVYLDYVLFGGGFPWPMFLPAVMN